VKFLFKCRPEPSGSWAKRCGKSTLIKCLLNLEKPTSGTAKVLGLDIRAANRASREKIGYSPEQDSHVADMVGCEYVTYAGQLSGMPFMRLAREPTRFSIWWGMGQERYRKVETYSTGMRQRIKLAQGSGSRSAGGILLDEPTNGLDPSGREHIPTLIGSLWKISVSVWSTPRPICLRDIERVCDQVIIIGNGRLIEHGSIRELKNRHQRVVVLTPSAEADRFYNVIAATGREICPAFATESCVSIPDSDSLEWVFERHARPSTAAG